VENADRGITRWSYGQNNSLSALEIFPAKEAKRRFDCGGKHLGCPKMEMFIYGAGGGLQYGLSGNRAMGSLSATMHNHGASVGDTPDVDLMGNRLAGNGRHSRGKSGPT